MSINISYLFCGFHHTIIYCYGSDNLLSFGGNYYEQCGNDESCSFVFPPKIIRSLFKIKYISCGLQHTICCRSDDGAVFAFGSNSFGQLGLGKDKKELNKIYSPQLVNIPPIQNVSCGLFFTICLSTDGNLWSFGEGTSGQLGIGKTTNINSPTLISNINNVCSIECGGSFVYCKTNNNDFYSWGMGINGQLSKGDNMKYTIPGLCKNLPDNIISYSCGGGHILFLTSDKNVYSCGSNCFGQLGINNKELQSINTPKQILNIPKIISIKCAYGHSAIIDINNHLWVFGYNEYAQLGLNDFENRYQPTKNEYINDITNVFLGGTHTFICDKNNNYYTFGYNNINQLGVETMEEYQKIPTRTLNY